MDAYSLEEMTLRDLIEAYGDECTAGEAGYGDYAAEIKEEIMERLAEIGE